MASNATTQITILWADEVKQAAAAMRDWHDCKDDEQRHKLMVVAFNAALVALWGYQGRRRDRDARIARHSTRGN